MSCCPDLAAKHEAAVGHFKTEILKLQAAVAELQSQIDELKKLCPVLSKVEAKVEESEAKIEESEAKVEAPKLVAAPRAVPVRPLPKNKKNKRRR